MVIDGYCALGVDREYDLTTPDLLRALDAAGVDRAVVAPVDRCLAVHNREGNRLVMEAVRSHPDRLIPACSANPWFGEKAVSEVSHAIHEGARMLVLHPFVQGYLANDELVWPLIEVAGSARIPVYIHTGMPGNASPWQVVDLAFRFEEVDFIMGHCGATDFWNDVVPAAKACDRVYLESSLARPFGFSRYLAEAGGKRGIMGSFAPINDLAFEWEQMRGVIQEDMATGVFGDNLRMLLEKRGEL